MRSSAVANRRKTSCGRADAGWKGAGAGAVGWRGRDSCRLGYTNPNVPGKRDVLGMLANDSGWSPAQTVLSQRLRCSRQFAQLQSHTVSGLLLATPIWLIQSVGAGVTDSGVHCTAYAVIKCNELDSGRHTW